jgi:flavin-dependent dehydrogenase
MPEHVKTDGVYEVAVVGAGPAGAATAAHLARAGRHVVLLDKARFPRDKPCAEVLSPVTAPMLAELGVLAALEADHPARRLGFRVYAPGGRVFQGDFAATRDASGHTYCETGLAIPRRRLDDAILGAARDAGAEVREGWRLAQLERIDGAWQLAPASGEPLRSPLLIAADGVYSTVARRLGLYAPGRLRKIALVAHLRGIAGLSSYVEIHVAGRRYVGVAPLESREDGDRDTLCNVAMVVDEVRDGRALAGRPEAFLLDALGAFPGLRGRLAGVTVVRRTLAVSRLNTHVRRLSAAGLLLVGDAAGYYDPFTGEGIARGLRSARLAADAAQDALAAGDLSARALARYDQRYRAAFRGKRLVERIIQTAVQHPLLMDHIAGVLGRRKPMADTIVAVTGDILPPSAVLRPSYLLRLVI